MDDQNPHSYQVNQDNKEYIITTLIENNILKVECQDNNSSEFPVYTRSFTLNELRQYSDYFSNIASIYQAQNEFNITIENQKVTIFPKNQNLINITFFIKDITWKSAGVTLQLPKEKMDFSNNNIPLTNQRVQTQFQPDMNSVEFQGENITPLDNERINRLEEDSNKLQNDHNFLRNELNQLMNKIDDLNNIITKLKDSNLLLNQRTMALKEENSSRREEANKLRENNESLKRQNQQLREKKNKLEFLVGNRNNENKSTPRISKSPFSAAQPQYNQFRQDASQNQYPSKEEIINQNNNLINNKINNDLNYTPNENYQIATGNILKSQNELDMLIHKINKYNQNIKFNLIYKATVDSDKAIAFHNNCDKAGSSVVLIETTKGKRFGGFTRCSWEGDCINKKDNDAFVFSLDKMMTYDIISGKDAIGCYPDFGPVFFGCQIRVYDNAFIQGGTTFQKGVNYQTLEDYELSGGEKAYGIKEIEVYEVRYD